ncbi:VOC family protein [Acidisoma silvae]|uniref:VOC family protein n=1 Tax=Acidisoma silvae TaxID=2802396 RepID=A0A963YSB5_9PROT|nr:VOC family protein [Acidisoma silvae]MCB8876036.1 VOC family protein [Acidisoma silvae]
MPIYATFGTNDLDKATAFYDELLGMIGATRVAAIERGVFYGRGIMEFGILQPADGERAVVGNGAMIALDVPSRAAVHDIHAKALELGCRCEGKPGLRDDDPDGFYGAYFRDPEGNKLCVFRIGAN